MAQHRNDTIISNERNYLMTRMMAESTFIRRIYEVQFLFDIHLFATLSCSLIRRELSMNEKFTVLV